MPDHERTLYQFRVSHFCEKTRWNLDAKGLSYAIQDLVPGMHRKVTRRVSGSNTVPILVDGSTVLADSTQIALHLERAYPTAPSLLPAAGPERERALELEDFFDEVAGIHVRRWAYGHVLESPVVATLLFREAPLLVRLLGRVMLPMIKSSIRRLYRISPDTVEESRKRLLEGLDRLEREIGGDPDRYLVGDRLSIADITAASLYGPLIMPPNSPWREQPGVPVPPVIAQMRDQVLARPAGQWLVRRYERDRQRPASA
jgi:glutathione S-transferase